MDDAEVEVEAALLALGPPLLWDTGSGIMWYGRGEGPSDAYGLCFFPNMNGWLCGWFGGARTVTWRRVVVPSLAEAKAACEWHRTTGDWEAR